jgi:putative ABC transport system substrate-binding protein
MLDQGRRDFIGALGGAAATSVLWRRAARAQKRATPLVGLLSSASPQLYADRTQAFRQGLGETGFVEGRNVAIEYRWAEGQYDRLLALAADLAARQVSLIASLGGIPAARAAKSATATIPIVFVTGTDPVAFGLVASLNRPGGNLTGVTSLGDEIAPKRLEFLHELMPAATTMALLVNPTNPNAEPQSKDLHAAARALGVRMHVLHASTEHDFEAAFARAAQLRAAALVIGPDTFFASPSRSEQLAALAARYAIPAISFTRSFTTAGGLMSYGGNLTDTYRIAGTYAGRILKGEKPAELPVQQITKVELSVNLRSAKALGLEVPATLLARADEVIE